jgi:hypothetical protein
MKRLPMRAALATAALLLLGARPAPAFDWDTFNGEDYEEPAGGGAGFELNPADRIYGLTLGSGTWLLHTPVFADYFLGFLYNGIEEGFYGQLGLTLRLMPHWRVAPFVGGGGTYDAIISRDAASETTSGAEPEKGNSYWGGHGEAGVRIAVGEDFYELLGRYTWSSSDIPDPNYGVVRIGYGHRF